VAVVSMGASELWLCLGGDDYRLAFA